ncbi:hypothetical protein DVQ80_04605 [Yersinia enterocolitica]|nr:hypothetical protein [Yersinia enterocolitica]
MCRAIIKRLGTIVIRISNRLVVRYVMLGLGQWFPTHFYGVLRSRNAAQNHLKNHGVTTQ